MSEKDVLLGSGSNGGKLQDRVEECHPEPLLVRKRPAVTVLSLVAGNFLCASIVSLQAPFFPQEAESKGATATQYGLIFGVYQLVLFISSPIMGKLVTHVEPKLLLCSGMFLLGSCCILFGLLAYSPPGAAFLGLAFAIRILEGVGSAAYNTTTFTIIAAEFPGKVGTTFATAGAAFGIGLIVGPTIGGALYEAGGFDLPFTVMGILMVVYSFVSYFLLPRVSPDKNGKSFGLRDTLIFWGHYKALVPAFCTLTTFLCIGFNSAILEPHIRQFGLTPFLVGLVFIISGGIYGMTATIWGYIADKWVSPKVLCLVGTLFSIVFTLLVGPAPFFPFHTKLWLVIVALTFFGVGSGAQFVCSFAALNKDTKKRGYPDSLSTNGLVSSVFTTAQSLGSFVGPSLGGYLFDNVGYRKATMMLLSLQIVMVILAIFYIVQERRENAALKQAENDLESSRLIKSTI